MLRKRMMLLYPLIGLALMFGASASTATAAGGVCSSTNPQYCPAPTVTTTAATGINATSAILNGSVNPGGAPTTCQFAYGTTASYGSTTTATSYGNGTQVVPVSTLVNAPALTPSTTYHFQLSCTNAAGTGSGVDQTFTTPATSGPTVVTTAASTVGASSATLNGTVNPNGIATACVFDYGTSTKYTTATLPAKSFPAGFVTQSVAVTVIGLTPGTLYDFQLVCSSGGGTKAVTANGGNLTFTTLAPVSTDKPPTVVTGASSLVTNQSATLSGTVNPNGVSTGCYFQYGTTTSYGTDVADTTAFTGTTAQPVSEAIAGLAAATTYHYQLVCANDGGATAGADETFTTSSPYAAPIVRTAPASAVNTVAAVLNGAVLPNGNATVCEYVYGTTVGYGAHTPAASVGSGTAAVPVATVVSGLAPNTTYHFELVCASAGGVAVGGDESFTTAALGTVVSKVAFASKKTLKVSKKGYVSLKLKCTQALCAGTLTLSTTTKSKIVKGKKASAAKAKTHKVGSKRYSIAAGKTVTVKVKVGKKYFAYLKKKHKLGATAKAQDKDKSSASKKVSLHYKKPKKKK